MTESERCEIKSELIKLGFWGEDDDGDPTADEKALAVLLRRIEERLPVGLRLAIDIADALRGTREMQVLGPGVDHTLSAGEDLFAAICRAALALPEFLKEPPECAADQVKAPVGEPTAKPKRKASKRPLAKKAVKKSAKKTMKKAAKKAKKGGAAK